MRIHLAGGAASGKTTLASRLGQELGLKVFHLDAVGFDPTTTDHDRQRRREALLAEVTECEGSVTEGSFVDWAEPFFDIADVVIFLDIPTSTALRRVVVRHALASLRRANAYKGLRRLLRFLRATHGWYTSRFTHDHAYGLPPGTTGVTHLADTRQFLERFSSKLVVCVTSADIEALVQRVRRP